MKNDAVLAVLAMNITESPRFHSPTRRSEPDDFIEKHNWTRDTIESQNGDPFRRIMVDGHTWMRGITIDLHLCKRPQGNAGGDPQIICFPHQIPMTTPNSLLQFMPQHQNSNFPKLDAELQHVWEAFVNKLAEDNSTDVQPGVLRMRWDMVWKQLQGAMRLTAHERFISWYGSEKRRLSDEE